MTEKNYPEEIYPDVFPYTWADLKDVAQKAYDLGKKHGCEVPESATWILDALKQGALDPATAIGQAVTLGKEHSQADTGDWHNLTEAIADGEPIDFEKLDGREIRMVNDDDGRELRGYNLEKHPYLDVEKHSSGWLTKQGIDSNCASCELEESWNGKGGWKLYVKGELPLRKRTAEQLPFGTEFQGTYEGVNSFGVRKFVKIADGLAQDMSGRDIPDVAHLADQITVIKVLGMYGQKESE